MSDNLAQKNTSTPIHCRPFVKWAGGKTQLLPVLLTRIPENYNTYFEPFVGAGALFFALQPSEARISDANKELINTYCVVRDQVEELITHLSQYSYDSEVYYATRARDREDDFQQRSPVERAARFIYLNKTCFNGLYRVNSRGYFNVPFGRHTNPTICDARNLRACSRALQRVAIDTGDYVTGTVGVAAGDFVYLDPPYMPLSRTSSFTRYAKDDFTAQNQEELRNLCRRLDASGTYFMLSNSSAPLIRELYKEFRVEEVPAVRAINSRASNRGIITELLIRNYG